MSDLFSLLEQYDLHHTFSDEVTWVKQGTFSAVYLINTRDSAFNDKLKDAGLLKKCNDYLFRIS